MKLQLIEFSAVRFGVHAKALDQGSLALVPASALAEHGQLVTDHIRRSAPEVLSYQPADLLQPGDVLLVGKGNINHAAVWTGSHEDTLASSTLYVIRTDPRQVLPQYLASYLNSTTARAWFTMHRKTGTVAVLSRQALNTLLVPVPSLEEQGRIIQLATAAQQAQELLHQLSTAHTLLLNSVWAQLDKQ
jgi:hypothetical protein